MIRHTSFFFLFSCCLVGYSQQRQAWNVTAPFEKRCFIENLGQYADRLPGNSSILFYAETSGTGIYFTNKGFVFTKDIQVKRSRKELREFEARFEEERKSNKHKAKEEKEKEEQFFKYKRIPVFAEMNWENANADISIEKYEKLQGVYCYANEQTHKTIKAGSWTRLVYSNIYPGIDAVFYFPSDSAGFKYNYIVHEGADANAIHEKWLGDVKVQEETNGDLSVTSKAGEFVSKSPVSYTGNKHEPVKTRYEISGNTVTYAFDEKSSGMLVIDPWIQIPGISATESGYDIDFDVAGNTYVYGGNFPLKLVKYDPSGVLLWSYTASPLSSYYGDFAIDYATGTVYIVGGYGSSPDALKLSSSGTLLATHPTSPTMNEMWRIAFSSCTNQAVIGGGGTAGFNQVAYLDTNLTSMGSVNVLGVSSPLHDIALLAVDNYGWAYFLHSYNAVATPSGYENKIIKSPLPAFLPIAYAATTPYNFREVVTPGFHTGNGYNGLAIANKSLYSFDGYRLQKRNSVTGTLLITKKLGTPPVSDSTFRYWSGVTVDECQNLFAGSRDTVYQYDSLLNTIAFYKMPGFVYDLKISKDGLLYVTGNNFVKVFFPDSLIACPSPIVPNLVISGSACDSGAVATVTPTGGQAPYVITWNTTPVQTGPTATGLYLGSYSVTITDASCSGNVLVYNFDILPGFDVNPNIQNASCYGAIDGAITAIPLGGAAPYTYVWDTLGVTDSTISGLPAGTYSVTIMDSTGCAQTSSFTITEPTPLNTNANGGPISCNGGTADLVALPTGGTGPYTIVWNGTTTNDTLYNASAGIYTITVTDDHGCTGTFTDTLVEPPLLTLSIATDSVGCSGTPLGSMTATAGGGTGSYDYLWSNNASNNTPNNPGLTAGVYTLTVTDDNGCTVTVTDTVFDLDFPSILFNDVLPCNSGSNGSITAVPSGGSPATTFNYAWNTSPVQTGLTANGISAGTYTLSVTANGCTNTYAFNLGENSIIDTMQLTGVACGNSSSVELVLPAVAQPVYTWFLNGAVIPGQAASSYTIDIVTVPQISATWFMNGCKYSTSASSIGQYPIASTSKIPNIFSPNGDAANNKFYAFTFVPGTDPAVISYLFTEYSMQVYNRWGQLMFETTDPNEGWKGDDLGGTPAAEGVYFVILKYNALCSDSPDAVIYNGTVQVVR